MGRYVRKYNTIVMVVVLFRKKLMIKCKLMWIISLIWHKIMYVIMEVTVGEIVKETMLITLDVLI